MRRMKLDKEACRRRERERVQRALETVERHPTRPVKRQERYRATWRAEWVSSTHLQEIQQVRLAKGGLLSITW